MDHLIFLSHSSADAPIAQLICHRLEETGLRCWIAPRDILHGDWAGSIMDGLARADVCVIVVGGHSANSPEVLKEITEATRTCRYIIPFKVDSAELPPKMRYHLGPCHWLDASSPPIEQRIEELRNRIGHLSEEDAVYQNARQLHLQEHMAWPRPLFLGREKELEEIAERLQEEGILFLQGMGGIGKSEIAKAYAASRRSRYDTVLFLSYEGSISDLICGDSVRIDNFPPRDAGGESEEQFFRRKMEALRRIVSDRTLIILDNYDVDDDPSFPELANAGAHLLITTRNEHEDYETLTIGPIADFDTVRELFLAAWGRKPRPEELSAVDEIIRLVGRHTITVELIARQMKASRRNPAEMLALLEREGLDTRLKESIRRDGGAREGSAYEIISKLFVLSDLTPESEQILRWMAMVPFTGMDIRLFHDICELDSYDEINDLVAHSWLNLDEDDVLSMHPVVADVVRRQLNPSVENGRTYIAGLWREVGNLWRKDREERARMWPYYAKLIRDYFDPVPDLWTEFADLQNNAWICGRYALAIETGHRFLDYTRKQFPDDHEKIGKAADFLGGCYHNAGDDAGGAPWFEEGMAEQRLAIREDSDRKQWAALCNVIQKAGRTAYLTGDFARAGELLAEAVRIGEEKCGRWGYYANALFETGRMYQAMGDWEKALRFAGESQKLYVEIFGGPDNPNSAIALTDIGKCRMQLGDLDGAGEALEESLRLNLQFNGASNLQTFRAKETLADLAAARGDTAGALRTLEELEAEMEQSFGQQNPKLQALREKIRGLSGGDCRC